MSKEATKKLVVDTPHGPISDSTKLSKSATVHEKTFIPDYSSMWAEIQKVSMPVSFAALKAFYRIS